MADTEGSGTFLKAMSVLIAAATAFLGWRQQQLTDRIDERDRADAQAESQQSLELAHESLNADYDAERRRVMLGLIPALVGADPGARELALTELKAIYPNDAVAMLAALNAAAPTVDLGPATADAADVAATTGDWGIVFGTDTSLEAANFEVGRAADAGFSPIEVFHRGDFFASVVVGFASEDDASAVLPAIQSSVRSSAFVVQLNLYCPSPIQEDEIRRCS